MDDRVIASAPGKLLLFGEHAVVYGAPCIVTAVDRRMRVSVRKNGKDSFRMDAPDMGLMAYSKTIADLGKRGHPKEVRFVETLYRRFLARYPQNEGIDVVTKSEFSCQFGFGSSSAVTVAFAKALSTLYGIKLTRKKLFDLCYQAVLDVQGVGSGFDIASAIWGGTIYYVPPAKVVRRLAVSSLPIVVGYTGVKADTPTLVRQVAELRRKNPKEIGGLFDAIVQIVERASTALEKSDWKKVGGLMNHNQQLLEKLGVSSEELDLLVSSALQAGAYGAKLSGAGGGDCMVAVSEERKIDSVVLALGQGGGVVLDVGLDAEGVRIEE